MLGLCTNRGAGRKYLEDQGTGPPFTLDEVEEVEMGKEPVRVLITGAAGEACLCQPEVGLVVFHSNFLCCLVACYKVLGCSV